MKLVRIAIFLTGLGGLILGGLTGISSLKTDQEQASIRTNESLKSQATLLVDQFFGVLESTKSSNQGSGLNLLPYLTHRAVLNLKLGSPSDFESFTSVDPSGAKASLDPVLEERVLLALKNQLSIGDLKITKIGMGTYPLNDPGNKEGIFVAQPVFKMVNGTPDTSVIEKANVSLIDPSKAFSGVQKLASGESVAYLVGKNGKVLAHTVDAYVGTDLKRISKLKESIENLFLGAQTGSVERFTNVDGSRAQVAFVRAGSYPFAFGVEQKAASAVLSKDWVREQFDSGAARKNAGFALVLIAIALMVFTVVSSWASSEVNKQIEASREARAENAVELPQVPALAQVQGIPENSKDKAQEKARIATDRFIESRSEIQKEQERSQQQARLMTTDRDYHQEWISKLSTFYTLEAIEKELVSLTSELTESPVLYLRYQRRQQTLNLASLGGSVQIPNYSEMHAYVRKDIELQVEHLGDSGKVASLTHYGPINKLIVSNLNIAHFEAWGVTSSPEISGQSKLMGVLVILHAGMRSAQVRPTLARILKDAGNYLYAQSNKLKPKSNLALSDAMINLDSERG